MQMKLQAKMSEINACSEIVEREMNEFLTRFNRLPFDKLRVTDHGELVEP